MARACGECTVCCTALAIDTPEFRKAPGITCTNCTAKGCSIYETRFPICRSYFCGWIQLPELDDAWRPDRSGVIVSPMRDNIPDDFALREGVELLILTGEKAIRRAGFAAFVARSITGGVATFLAMPGPTAHYPARVLLNRPLASAVARRDEQAVIETLVRIVKSAAQHRFEPFV